MQTSKKISTALKALIVLVMVVALNGALTFVFEPYGSKSQIMWTDYRQQENLDTVFVGTSLTERAFDPMYFDSQAHSNSYNMATPGQWIEESQSAMETAIADHPINTVVYGLEFSSLQGDKVPHPGRAFYQYKNQGDPLGFCLDAVRLLSKPGCYTTADSINWMFPWITNHVKGLNRTVANVTMKLDGTSIYDAAEANEPGWTYYGRGYGNYTDVNDPNKGKQRLYTDDYKNRELSPDKINVLIEMADYCEERGIDFVVVMPPIPSYNIAAYGKSYFAQAEEVRKIVEEHGGEFYDLNMARPELFDTTNPEFFADHQHLNKAGGEAASKAIATIFEARDGGQDVDSLFYTKDEYRQAMDFISLVTLKATVTDDGIELKARALISGDSPVEYQMMVFDPDEKEWVIIRDWSEDPTYLFDPEESGQYKVCVNARLVGTDVEYDRYRVVKVRL